MPLRSRRRSLAGRLLLALGLLMAASAAFAAWLVEPLGSVLLAVCAALLLSLPLALLAARRVLQPILSLFRALDGTVSGYRDGDFSFGVAWDADDELGDLVRTHNELGSVLREQRQSLVQRELLLDTLLQNTPVAMLLLDPGERVVYANLAARRQWNGGRRLEGLALETVLDGQPPPLREAIEGGRDGLVGWGEAEDEDTWHLAQRSFRLNGRAHRLLLLRPLTHELRRAEVRTWKKVIRVISHELNNSLAPIASLAHSGAELNRRGQHERLGPVFETIEERARHLNEFIRGYARFAKLPNPQPESVELAPFLQRLAAECSFALIGAPPARAQFDPAQMSQALLNLLKNAHESGSPAEAVELSVRDEPDWLRIEVADRGPGMSSVVLEQALLPFYSTKRNGTGLGLALVREIVEAHGGQVRLAQREGGGLSVLLRIPRSER
ncbi:ATP-binding protein [uncultured Aquimonas sp.]|uniref:sensor histidine kinase n=1 Tax=uncultured Aquimonas sp. TaxID=385483 RepID=UPI00086D46E7|nr:ATP-binding protein [uncultured Aquimonas sp.]ODU46169.1 MAG: histidine kinase [Xanthomonadaceae bacterium SCN 69-123]